MGIFLTSKKTNKDVDLFFDKKMELDLKRSTNGAVLSDDDKAVRKIMESILNSDVLITKLNHVFKMNGLEIVMKTSPCDLIQENHLRNIPIDKRNIARTFVEKVLSRKQLEYSRIHLINLDSLTLSRMVPEILNAWNGGATDVDNLKICIPLPQVCPEPRKRITSPGLPVRQEDIIELIEFSEKNTTQKTSCPEILAPEISSGSLCGGLLDTRKQQLDNYIDSCKTSEECLNATALYNGYTNWCDLHGYDKYTRPILIGAFRKRIPECEIKDTNGRSKGWSLSLPPV